MKSTTIAHVIISLKATSKYGVLEADLHFLIDDALYDHLYNFFAAMHLPYTFRFLTYFKWKDRIKKEDKLI